MWAISTEGPAVLTRFSADVSPAAGVTGEQMLVGDGVVKARRDDDSDARAI
jgi:hypothetical protein